LAGENGKNLFEDPRRDRRVAGNPGLQAASGEEWFRGLDHDGVAVQKHDRIERGHLGQFQKAEFVRVGVRGVKSSHDSHRRAQAFKREAIRGIYVIDAANDESRIRQRAPEPTHGLQ
jgi:hypothetical protein